MRILITGARGVFPTALIRRLAPAGHELVLFDIEPLESGDHTCVQGDVRDAGAITAAMQGCGAVVHAAALDADMQGRRNDDDFFAANVVGTQNVLSAMQRLGVEHLVFSSSDTVYGLGMKGHRVMDETVPCVPQSSTGLTKVLCEELCAYYSRHHHLRVAVMRYGQFGMADWKVSGIGRLTNWVDREDVAQANELALGALINEEFRCETFLISSAKPFVESDWPELAENPAPIIDSYWPGSVDLMARHHLRLPAIHTRYNIDKARTMLGFEPVHNFDEFLHRLRYDHH